MISVQRQEKPEYITLTFPEISNSELSPVLNDLKEEINQGLVSIKVERFRDGSILVDLMLHTAFLLEEEYLQMELIKLLTRLSDIGHLGEVLKIVPVVNIVMSLTECEGNTILLVIKLK